MKRGAAYLLAGIFGLSAIFWLAYLCFYRFERHLLAYYVWFAVGGGVALAVRRRSRLWLLEGQHHSTAHSSATRKVFGNGWREGKDEKVTGKILYRYFFISIIVIFLQSVVAAIANSENILKFLLHDFLVFLPWYAGWYVVLSCNDLKKEKVFFIVSLHAFLFEELYLQPPLLLPFILPLVVGFYWLMFYPVFLLFPLPSSSATAASRILPFSRALFLPLAFALMGQVVSDTLAAQYPHLFSPHNM